MTPNNGFTYYDLFCTQYVPMKFVVQNSSYVIRKHGIAHDMDEYENVEMLVLCIIYMISVI